jgi:membrane protease YdiL (CAAX protease family)
MTKAGHPAPPDVVHDTVTLPSTERIDRRAFLLTGLVVAAGSLALAARGVGYGATLVTAMVGSAALLVPVAGTSAAGDSATGRSWWVAVAGIGVLAFAAVRATGPPITTAAGGWTVGAATIAAIAEEAFFRRLAYGWLEGWGGPLVAVCGAALLFGAVHVPFYGTSAFPIDLGAGLLFGWQRWATKGWAAPAATHVAANLLQLW